MRMSTSAPAQKVVGASVGAAAAQIIVYVIGLLAPEASFPEEVRGALTVLLTFAAGYLTPPAARDQVVAGPEGAR